MSETDVSNGEQTQWSEVDVSNGGRKLRLEMEAKEGGHISLGDPKNDLIGG
jgi:hypothetical protein